MSDRPATEQDAVEQLPPRVRVAAYALCDDTSGRLLVCRIAPGYPGAGLWTLPGGGLDFGEDPVDGVLRELREETGLEGSVDRLAFVDSRSGPALPELRLGPWHGIRIVYHVTITGGELRDELEGSTDRAAWFSPAEARRLPLADLVQAAFAYGIE